MTAEVISIVNGQQDVEFEAWPKTPRLNKTIHISEKIDGTNGAIIITEDGRVAAQSRNRLITPGKDTDNYGFASWVYRNAGALRDVLGVGRHFGEWAGKGIQRGYDLDQRTFFLFNPRWQKEDVEQVDGLAVIPQLGSWGKFDSDFIDATLDELIESGSHVDGKTRPEGIIVYHSGSRQVFKVLADNDDLPKSVAERHLKAVA